MKLNLRKDDPTTEVTIRYGTSDDLGFVNVWDAAVGSDQHPFRLDACLFARLAVKRYQTHRRLEKYATSIDDIADYTQDNPYAEVANFVLLEPSFPEFGQTIGVCHFRRTWCNNFVIDYLSVHPSLVRPKSSTVVKGAGSALLYFTSTVAIMTGASLLWGEATQNSCKFYRDAFRLDETKDLIQAPRNNLEAFLLRMQTKHGYPDHVAPRS